MEERNNTDNTDKQISRFEKNMKKAKNISIFVICAVVILGSIGMFIASIVSENSTIDNLSSFIGIILGIVALVTSIVSMILSFYSIEKSSESEQNLNQLLFEIKSIQTNTENIVSRIDEKQEQQLSLIRDGNQSVPNEVGGKEWNEVKKDESE